MPTITAPQIDTISTVKVPTGIGETHRGHSAEVEMTLTANGREFTIGQMGPDFLLLRDQIDVEPCNAQVMLSIDGNVKRWEVFLPNGIDGASREVRVAAIRKLPQTSA